MRRRLLLIWLALAAFAGAGELPAEASWRIWFEAKSAHAPVANPIPGAERTEWVAGFRGDDGLAYFSKQEFEGLKTTAEAFAKRARENAETDLQTLTPAYTRNRKKVIEYAELHSDQPIVASAILAPGFLKLFKDTLGEKVFVIIPNRFTAYVFPALASNYLDYAPMVFTAFGETAWPVSTEVFEVSGHGVKSAGHFERP